ncbi:MAG: hypothetical protein K0R03_1291 [Moraxellaceae bacterium]|jgi:hypothetical protein|nr:hypothetical protein [Moraxellaceae bacterium]
MERSVPHGLLKAFSYVILLLMVIALGYSAYISISHWDGIGV